MSRDPRVVPRHSRFVQLFRTTPPQTVCPNFFVLAHANGCAFSPWCTYCYLRSSFWYDPTPKAFSNVEQLLDETVRWIMRDHLECWVLNTGNLSDSLAFEPVRPLVGQLVDVFRAHAQGRPHTLLLVTKAGLRHCLPLLHTEPCPNVVVSFSVNTPEAAAALEQGAPPVHERLRAASALKEAGWRVRIRIDPMVEGFSYRELAREVARLGPERVTLGTLRAERNLLRVVRNGVFSRLCPPEDPKALARYPSPVRLSLYQEVRGVLDGTCPLALCEEPADMWEALGLDPQEARCNCAL